VEEMNEAIVDRWNSVVGKRDTVWHLGDVCFGPSENLSILERLRGTKNLILGNHDQYGVREYIKYFNKIEAAKTYDGFLWTHVPIHPDQFYRFRRNMHGHLHSSRVLKQIMVETNYGPLPDYIVDERYVNVSCEHNNLTPKAWEDVKENR
jgi:calcineurin-like phosphoesterase family protein